MLGRNLSGKVDESVRRTLVELDQRLDRFEQMLTTMKAVSGNGNGGGLTAAQRADVVGLVGALGQGLIGENVSDPTLQNLPTGNGTVTSVNGASGASGFALTGTVTSAGSITFSISNAANARTTLGIDDIATKKSNLSAAVAPTVNEDSGDGYGIGSLWIDTSADNVYIATDVTVGAALWRLLN